MDAAKSVFETKGLEAASVSDIVDKVGVSRATFYVYFASKTDVFRLVAEDLVKQLLRAQRTEDVHDRWIGDVIRDTTVSTLDVTIEHLAMLTVLDHQALVDLEIREVWMSFRRRVHDRAMNYVQTQIDLGRIAPVPTPEALALMGAGMIAQFAANVVSGSLTREQAVDQIHAVWMTALGLPLNSPD